MKRLADTKQSKKEGQKSTPSADATEKQEPVRVQDGVGLRIINGPSRIRTYDQPGRVDNWHISNYPSPNRACTFRRTRLSKEAVQVVTICLPLCPFLVYRALPRSFEYYGHSVAMRLSTCRRSPSSLKTLVRM